MRSLRGRGVERQRAGDGSASGTARGARCNAVHAASTRSSPLTAKHGVEARDREGRVKGDGSIYLLSTI